jgi:hypothetical protein
VLTRDTARDYHDPAKQMPLDITREGDTPRHQTTLPFDAFGLTKGHLKRGIRFNVMVRDREGQQYRGYIELPPAWADRCARGSFPLLYSTDRDNNLKRLRSPDDAAE